MLYPGAGLMFALAPPAQASVAISGSEPRFAVRRILCVGRNYAEHSREMGGNPDREPPFFFTKPADAVVGSGARIPYPPATSDLQHEAELVVAPVSYTHLDVYKRQDLLPAGSAGAFGVHGSTSPLARMMGQPFSQRTGSRKLSRPVWNLPGSCGGVGRS